MGTQNSDPVNNGLGTKLTSIPVNDPKSPSRSSNWAGSQSRGPQQAGG